MFFVVRPSTPEARPIRLRSYELRRTQSRPSGVIPPRKSGGKMKLIRLVKQRWPRARGFGVSTAPLCLPPYSVQRCPPATRREF